MKCYSCGGHDVETEHHGHNVETDCLDVGPCHDYCLDCDNGICEAC